MKDSYSFDVDDAGLEKSYRLHRDAYIRLFDRLGFTYVIVQADAGAMGGSKSEEFLAVSQHGEDTFAVSPGGYAANVEAVTTPVPPALPWDDVPPAVVHDTPDSATIETLVAQSNELFPREDRAWEAADMLKNVVLTLVHPDGRREPLVIGLPGDREVDAKRLEAAVAPALVEGFGDADFEAHPRLVKGYIGPVSHGSPVLGEEGSSKIRYLLDPRVVPGTRWVTGANEEGRHVVDLVAGRDFTGDGTIDVAEVREGDPAPDGSGPLKLERGIEMGHVFQLGRKYAEALGLKVLDHNGKLVTVTMGSYGMGVSRAVAAIAEDTADDKGLCWPVAVAPFQVQVLATGKGDEVFSEAERIAGGLSERGLEVLFDDRKASPGVKFADSELLGMPVIIVVGRGLADGVVELRNRATGDKREVPVADAVAEAAALVSSL